MKTMTSNLRIILLGIFLSFTLGCGHIRGFANSALYKPLPSAGTFKVDYLGGNEVIATKLDKILVYQFKKLGYKPSDSKSANLKIIYSFSVKSAGSAGGDVRSTNTEKTRLNIFTGKLEPYSATEVISSPSVNLFKKSITVRIIDNKTGGKLWESSVEETGWCNQILVTAPYIFGLMFDKFPEEATNKIDKMQRGDSRAKEFMRLFPDNTDWGCN